MVKRLGVTRTQIIHCSPPVRRARISRWRRRSHPERTPSRRAARRYAWRLPPNPSTSRHTRPAVKRTRGEDCSSTSRQKRTVKLRVCSRSQPITRPFWISPRRSVTKRIRDKRQAGVSLATVASRNPISRSHCGRISAITSVNSAIACGSELATCSINRSKSMKLFIVLFLVNKPNDLALLGAGLTHQNGKVELVALRRVAPRPAAQRKGRG